MIDEWEGELSQGRFYILYLFSLAVKSEASIPGAIHVAASAYIQWG